MKILVVCDQGNNRSVTLAQHLKYWKHDVIAVGLKTNSVKTLMLLCRWADRIILTDRQQMLPVGNLEEVEADTKFIADTMLKIQTWDLGPDIYPRPFNKMLMLKVRALMEEHKSEYKPW